MPNNNVGGSVNQSIIKKGLRVANLSPEPIKLARGYFIGEVHDVDHLVEIAAIREKDPSGTVRLINQTTAIPRMDRSSSISTGLRLNPTAVHQLRLSQNI